MGAESSEWVDVDNDDAEEFFNHNVDNDAKENHDHNLEEGLGRVSSTQHSGDRDLAPIRRRRGAVGECAVLSGQGAGRFTYKSKEYAIAGALASIGISGVLMTSHLLDYVSSEDGSVIHRYKPIAWKTSLTSPQSGQIVPLMVAVAGRGTAYGYFPAVDDVGTKTGTAQTGTHLTDEWMIAFAPASAPTIAVAVVVPFQSIEKTGALVAGPIMTCLVEGVLSIQSGHLASGISGTCPT